jgi:hypothetical protein
MRGFGKLIFFKFLFQIILKILSDALMQMHTLMSHHVVAFAWINEEIGLCTSLSACVDEL